MERPRVVVAMSGGVDSSVAAGLLVEQGYQVVGIMLRLWSEGWREETPAGNRCCSLDALNDARQVADLLGFPLSVINAEADFKRHVVDYFLDEYASGRTPNPCTACNHHIKFDFLLRRTIALDAAWLATGHYARLQRRPDGQMALLRAADEAKDQSYMLYMLGQERLRRVLFPLGEMTKEQVRSEAARMGLPVANKKDSQEICFVGSSYRDFLARHIPAAMKPGDIVDASGAVLGRHHGLPLYTIGQRSGLNLARPERSYVTTLDAASNRLVVGGAPELLRERMKVRQTAFNLSPPDRRLSARIRSHGQMADCRLARDEDGWEVRFDEPQRAIAPGQVVVFYDGDSVIGGGIID